MTKILIVEDEAIIAADLRVILERLGYECYEADNGMDALHLINKINFDLFLLDISISGEMDGVELAGKVRSQSKKPLIFITSYFDHQTLERVKSIKPEAYIVKPFEERNLVVNIELALFRSKPHTEKNIRAEKLFVKDQNELIALPPQEILFIEADDNYSKVFTVERQYLLSHPIIRVEEKLVDQSFIRVHKSFIVNLNKVTSIQEGYIFISEHKIPRGRTYRQGFMDALTIL